MVVSESDDKGNDINVGWTEYEDYMGWIGDNDNNHEGGEVRGGGNNCEAGQNNLLPCWLLKDWIGSDNGIRYHKAVRCKYDLHVRVILLIGLVIFFIICC